MFGKRNNNNLYKSDYKGNPYENPYSEPLYDNSADFYTGNSYIENPDYTNLYVDNPYSAYDQSNPYAENYNLDYLPYKKKWKHAFGRILLIVFVAIAVIIFAIIIIKNSIKKNVELITDSAEYLEEEIIPTSTIPESASKEQTVNENVAVTSEHARANTDGVLSTYKGVLSAIDEAVTKGKDTIILKCSPSMYQALQEENQFYSKQMMLSEILMNCGIYAYSYYQYDVAQTFEIVDYEILDGITIVKAWNTGNIENLTQQQKQTLEKAKVVAAELKKSTQVETAYAIHDWICENVAYIVDESTKDDDCAIGAILNGQANCDGYSDAFYLLGSLTGLNVRVQGGDCDSSLKTAGTEEIGHMWNLIQWNDEWYHIDVTWDDGDMPTSYLWFFLGNDNMLKTHIFNQEATVPVSDITDYSMRPSDEYWVDSMEQFQNACHQVVRGKQPTAYFIFDTQDLYQQGIEKMSDYIFEAGYDHAYRYSLIDLKNTIVFAEEQY